MKQNDQNDTLDNAMRRLGGIVASPSLVLSYGRTTPLLERAWLRRLGLTKPETGAFLALLCQHGLMEEGAKAVVYGLCARKRVMPAEAARLLLQGEGWPETEEEPWDTRG